MSPGKLYTLAVACHAYLATTCLLNQTPSISNGVLLQIANFIGLGLYTFVVSKMAIELYDSQPLAWLDTANKIVGSIWLTIEVATYLGNVFCNMIFMLLRSLKETEVRIELMDKRKQLPSVDTIEAMNAIVQQYSCFGVPIIVILKMTQTCYVDYLDFGH